MRKRTLRVISRSNGRRRQTLSNMRAPTSAWPWKWTPSRVKVRVGTLPMSWRSAAQRTAGRGTACFTTWRVCAQTSLCMRPASWARSTVASSSGGSRAPRRSPAASRAPRRRPARPGTAPAPGARRAGGLGEEPDLLGAGAGDRAGREPRPRDTTVAVRSTTSGSRCISARTRAARSAPSAASNISSGISCTSWVTSWNPKRLGTGLFSGRRAPGQGNPLGRSELGMEIACSKASWLDASPKPTCPRPRKRFPVSAACIAGCRSSLRLFCSLSGTTRLVAAGHAPHGAAPGSLSLRSSAAGRASGDLAASEALCQYVAPLARCNG